MGVRVVISELGEDPLSAIESFASLQPQDPPIPAPHDVVIAIKSASVGWVDLLMASGQYQHIPTPPYTPGLEYAGIVHAAGADAPFTAGERVLVDPFLAGPRSHGDYRQYGGYASYAVAPANAVHRIPGTLTFDHACSLLGNYETAYHCLIARGRLTAGETVLINGASGSTGMAAVHIAKLVGATVIAIGRSQSKLEIVRAQGADHTLVVTPSLRDDVKALTNGRGVDVVYDGVGGDLSLETLRCLRFGGRFLIVGWAATPAVARGKGQRGAPNANTLPTNIIMMKGIDVLGCPTAITTVNDPSIRPPRLAQILAWAAEGKLTPYISHAFPLADFKQAMLAKWRGEVIGGAVLHPPI
jgi:NADPH:quinone reductase